MQKYWFKFQYILIFLNSLGLGFLIFDTKLQVQFHDPALFEKEKK